MNIFLIPYTWLRHFHMALWCGGAGMLAWWCVLSSFVVLGPDWPASFDGPILIGSISAAVAGASILGEGNLRRTALIKRIPLVALAFALTLVFTLVWYNVWHFVAVRILFSGEHAEHATDPSLVSITYRLGAFAMGGISCGLGPIVVRKGNGIVSHLAGGLAAGLAGGGTWHILNSIRLTNDLYWAGAALGLVWGAVFGLLAWGIPDALYAGWIRVLTPNRFGRRIPIDAPDGSAKERFIGHFPRGLDLFLPGDDGVLEMHVSIAVDTKQRYAARGLSLAPTMVRRLLERVNLAYDPRRPAPLETTLSSGDRLTMGSGAQRTEVEFLMLPREES